MEGAQSRSPPIDEDPHSLLSANEELLDSPTFAQKRPRPSMPPPSLEEFQVDHNLDDFEMIKICATYAAYLRAVHKKRR